jgi:transcriptional regulator with XRE-family HTH domain
VKKSSRFKTLREFIDDRKVTQGDIARELGISESALSSYLSGVRTPNRELALRLSRDYGISLEGLLNPEQAASA